jgi:hypothetical protein
MRIVARSHGVCAADLPILAMDADLAAALAANYLAGAVDGLGLSICVGTDTDLISLDHIPAAVGVGHDMAIDTIANPLSRFNARVRWWREVRVRCLRAVKASWWP